VNFLIAGLAKSGTTMLFSRIQRALDKDSAVFFEPEKRDELLAILQRGEQVDTLTKVLVGRVMPDNDVIPSFDKQVLIYRDPRDQFVSMLLYLFYDFQLSGDQAAYDRCYAALAEKQREPAAMSSIALYNLLADSVGRAPIAVFNNLHRVQNEYSAAFSPYRARYEDLLDGHWSELESYLGIELAVEADVPHEYHRVVRSKGYGDWQNWLNREDMNYVEAHWGNTISSLGYSMSNPIEHQAIAKKTTLDYVDQFNPARH
jgi:hypothetical protein